VVLGILHPVFLPDEHLESYHCHTYSITPISGSQ
jgi:hypothetical protein